MADDKKYYYMRLKEDFFESNEIVALESLQDGYLYSNILLKLYLRSLKDEGRLMLSNTIPYNAQMIAAITRHQVGTVERALQLLLDSGTIYMLDIQNYIGKASTEADRIRAYRARIAEEKRVLLPESGKCPYKCTPKYRDKSIECRDNKKEYIISDEMTESAINYFFKRYEEETGEAHPNVSRNQIEEVSRGLTEYDLDGEPLTRLVDEYFGDAYHKGVCGESDKSIFHFASPTVLELCYRRAAGTAKDYDQV